MSEEKFPFDNVLSWILAVVAGLFIVGMFDEALFLVSAASDMSVVIGAIMLVAAVFGAIYLAKYVRYLVKGN
jgi:hypothetical protein